MKTLKFIAWAALGLLAVSSLSAGAAPLFDLSGEQGMSLGFVGMLVNKGTIQAAFTSLLTLFNNAFSGTPSNWGKIAMKVPSTTGQNDYAWLSRFPKMRRWIGEKNIKSLAAYKYSIANEDFEATVEVNRNDIEDDNLGIYSTQAQSAGQAAAQLPDDLVFEVVNAAFTKLGPDGQFFIDTDHLVNGVSVSNKGTKALSNATLAAAMASYGAARTSMLSMKDDEGQPLKVSPNILLVPPALETVANLLMTADKLNDNSPNPYKGQCTVVMDSRLTSATAWFLLDTTQPVKPFVYQERKAPVFVQQTDPQADDVFNRKVFKFGVEARAAAGYGFWQMAYGSDGTVA